MSTAARIWLSLAGFLLIAGAVYLVTAHEYAGAPLLLIGGVTFSYLAVVGRSAVRGSLKAAEGSPAGEESETTPPTIWPFAFAIAGLIIALGLIVSPLILVVGVLAFAVAAAGWLRDVARAHPGSRSSE